MKEIHLVASPTAIGKIPDAIGSSVPPWPILVLVLYFLSVCIPNFSFSPLIINHFTLLTTAEEVHPMGLKTARTPEGVIDSCGLCGEVDVAPRRVQAV